jgi:hypothetical protein
VTTHLPQERSPLASADLEPSAECRDLAANRPGQAAREQAVRAKQATPFRSAIARVLLVHTDERAWRIGAEGEELVGRNLGRLTKRPPEWRVLHAIPVGTRGADIDHLVIGPGGVFSLNTKHHPDAKIWVGGNAFLVNGVRQPYLRNSRHEAERASRLLTAVCGFPVEVTGVVVPVRAANIVIKGAPADVHVMNRRSLVRWLRRREPTLNGASIGAIYEAARRSTTWRQPGSDLRRVAPRSAERGHPGG